MEEYEVSSVVRGFHVYQQSWSPSLEEQLECLREAGNNKDRYAVAVLRHGSIVGHIPRISAACSLFIGLLTSSCFTSGFTLSLADRMSFGDRVVEALTVTSGSLKLSPLSFFAKYLSIDISDSRSRHTLDPGTRCDLR